MLLLKTNAFDGQSARIFKLKKNLDTKMAELISLEECLAKTNAEEISALNDIQEVIKIK